MHSKLRAISIPFLSLAVLLFNGCSRTLSTTTQLSEPASTPVYLTLDPQSVSLKHGDSWRFVATVSPPSSGLIWAVQESSSGGTVDSAGLYTAPGRGGIYHVTVTSKVDPSKSATATVSVGDAGFAPVGNLGSARSGGYTSTLLPSGKVYVAGGEILTADSNSDTGVTTAFVGGAEQFDPMTDTFQPAGKFARVFHTATVLQNGDVLFTGGLAADDAGNQQLTETAEILDAVSGSLRPTGSMSLARSGHTATLLKDGRVLIIGGYTTSGTGVAITKSAELYTPSSGAFSRVGDLVFTRDDFSATLLSDGRVLVMGGGTANAELFDPASTSFSSVGSTSSKWIGAATLLADNRVLISGETNSDSSVPIVAEIYDPATGKFEVTGKMQTMRSAYTATLLPDGTVLIAGGVMPVATATPGLYNQIPLSSTEIYNPATGSFSPGPTMREVRLSHTATLLADRRVLFVGGRGGPSTLSPLASAEVYR